MLIVYIGLASIVLSLVMLLALGKFASLRDSSSEPAVDVAASLRELLIARAEGRIDQDEFDRQQAALHVAVLQSPRENTWLTPRLLRWALPLVVLLGLVAIYAGYAGFKGGDKVAAPEETFKLPGAEQAAKAPSGGDLNTVVKRLADKMAADPNNGEGWLLLAKTYNELRKYGEADAAYEKAAALLPPDATMLADWADTHVMANGRKWDEAGRKIVKRAVAADPKHVKALALAGSEAFDRADYKAAIDFWKRMKAAAPADSMDGKLADANIAEANAMLSGKKPAGAEQGVLTGAVGGVVTINPKLKGKVAAGDTLFVVAKAPDGSGPPLAVGRYQGNDFPIEFRLDDSAAIMPGRTISQFSEVLVTAKISKSGSAEPAKGDILATPVKAKLGNTTLALELNQER
jgi:cytochrome c-type biogenesis protein CcmH